jgi:hypothetical protein
MPTAWWWWSASKIASLLPLAHKKVADEAARIAAHPAAGDRPRNGWTAHCARPACCNRRGDAVSQPTLLVTAADLAPQALALLEDFDIVYAGKTPTEEDMVTLCRRHDPVAIIVRYGKVGAAVMEAAPSLRVISKHGSGTDTIDKAAAAARGIEVRAAVGANAAAVAEHALALLLACAKSVVHWTRACTPATGTRPRTRAWS